MFLLVVREDVFAVAEAVVEATIFLDGAENTVSYTNCKTASPISENYSHFVSQLHQIQDSSTYSRIDVPSVESEREAESSRKSYQGKNPKLHHHNINGLKTESAYFEVGATVEREV